MIPEIKNIIHVEQTTQQVFVTSTDKTDFNSAQVRQEMEKVQKDVKTVLESAIIDSTKLSVNFTV